MLGKIETEAERSGNGKSDLSPEGAGWWAQKLISYLGEHSASYSAQHSSNASCNGEHSLSNLPGASPCDR